MTPEERFERIERNLLALTEAQGRTDEMLRQLGERVDKFVATSEASMKHMEQMTATLTEAAVNMDRVLTDFIRAMTTRRTNGKSE